ncbi:hypothetical protein EA462_14195 [Natrarchaeobius halalkaliphilus]|uniref:Type VI secretion protein n=1 Tax=Natrarchaeobius halalkaliphilus TaxID=1679091 RepID=A0A3N6M0D8_9EURY|nr:PAAR domain-containing protein [Natrarchaeobius halalkaliphilus]RQG88004.1 hypothetical protein EA462_14195 [Natrarchaeobius halalkaliphilus]
MGKPAARVGDPTAHGEPLSPGPGSPTVLIGGQPAWRAGSDFASCSIPNSGGAPHGGGTAVPTTGTVLINNLPAARVADQIPEAASDVGPNSIAVGEPTVLIGP